MYKGMLISFTETGKEDEKELKSWFVDEHIDERAIKTDGFYRSRLYECLDGGPKFFATYETKNFEVLESKGYLEKVSNQTEWSKKIIPKLSLLDRITGQITIDIMRGFGGKISIFRFIPYENKELKENLRKELADSLKNIVRQTDINGACLVENDSLLSNKTGEKAQDIGGKPNLEIQDEWVIIIEGQNIKILNKFMNEIINKFEKDKYIKKNISKNCYELIYGNYR